MAKPLVAELSTKIVLPVPRGSGAAGVTSDPHVRIRPGPCPQSGDRFGMADFQPRTAGLAGTRLPAQRRAVRAVRGRVRSVHDDMLAVCERNRRTTCGAGTEATGRAAQGKCEGM